MARQRFSLVIGPGMDRATGTVAVDPASPRDARNVYGRDAKYALRPGMAGTAYPDLPWGTDILDIRTMRATGDVLYCVYDRVTRQIRIFRLRPSTKVMQPLNVPANGIWGTLVDAAPFPVVLSDEADGVVMYAHAEKQIIYRLPTVYYTPDFDDPVQPGSLTTLMADLDGDGIEEPVYFTGVLHYLEYMGGWGYGSEEEGNLNRGDVFRLSKPGEPTVFVPENYLLCGSPKDHILSCVPVIDPGGSILAVGKESEGAYKIFGTSPADFGVDILDPVYGAVSARGSINTGKESLWWSTDGPRRVTLGGTYPIAQALELISPLPEDFPELGPDRLMFAAYDTRRYVVEFLFPNIEQAAGRTPCFALSQWNPENPRWTLYVREQSLCCVGTLLILDPELQEPPLEGYASDVTADDTGIAADARFRTVRVDWTNNEFQGNETVQLFVKPAGGDWSLALSVAISGTTQFATLSTLLPVQEYEFAIRYVTNFVRFNTGVGYGSDDPDDWTAPTAAGAKVTEDTSSADVAWVSGSFSGAANPINLTWDSAQQDAPYLLEKDAGAGFVTVVADLVAKSYLYNIPAPELGTTVTFRVTAQRGLIVGPVAAPDRDVDMFFDPSTPNWISAVWNVGTGVAALEWSAAAGASQYFLEKTNNGGASWSPVVTIPGTTYNYTPTAAEINTTVGFRVTGQNGGFSSPTSTTQNVTFTVALVAPVSTVFSGTPNGPPVTAVLMNFQWTNGVDDRQFTDVWITRISGVNGSFPYTLLTSAIASATQVGYFFGGARSGDVYRMKTQHRFGASTVSAFSNELEYIVP